MTRRSVATGACRASSARERSSRSTCSASMASSAPITLSARARSASSRAVVALPTAEPTRRVISTRRPERASSSSWNCSRMATLPRGTRGRPASPGGPHEPCQRPVNDIGIPGELRAKPSAGRSPAPGILGGAAYSGDVSPSWTSVLAGFVGVVVGALAVLAFRASERERLASLDRPDPELPPGVNGVLGVLRSAAVVLDAGDGVVKATPAAYAFGLVRGHDLPHPQVREPGADAPPRAPGGGRGAGPPPPARPGPRAGARARPRPARPRQDLRPRPGGS